MSLFPKNHGVCEEQEHKRPQSQGGAGKAVSLNESHVSVKARGERSPMGDSDIVEKVVYQWMSRAPEGQQKGSSCEARKNKRKSRGEDGGDGNRERQAIRGADVQGGGKACQEWRGRYNRIRQSGESVWDSGIRGF